MHVNYHYILDYMRLHRPGHDGDRFLDYGCGAGDVVEAGREMGLDVFGADVFYDAADYRERVEEKGMMGGAVREIRDGVIDFPDCHFDIVANNMVLEHVADLDAALQEIARVLRPGGTALCMFPSKDVWREGHCGIPLLHWFPKGSQLRVGYARVLAGLGLGYHRDDKTASEWAGDFCDWLDRYTYYRTREEIRDAFASAFSAVEFAEEDYIAYRLARSRKASGLKALLRTRPTRAVLIGLFRKLGWLVIGATK